MTEMDKEQLEQAWFEGSKVAKTVYTLDHFKAASAEMDKAIGEAYNAAVKLKGMWDTFESIPSKQQPLYDQTMKVMSGLGKPRSDAHNVAQKLKRYR